MISLRQLGNVNNEITMGHGMWGMTRLEPSIVESESVEVRVGSGRAPGGPGDC